MAYYKNYGQEETKELAYDLRQDLAKQLGSIRAEIIEARKKRNYSEWLNLLDSLFIEISQKLTKDEIKEYNFLLKKINEQIEKNPTAFNDGGMNSEGIYITLRAMSIWINKKMERYDMFGSKREPEDF